MSDAYPSTAELKATQLTPEREAYAREKTRHPLYADATICALINALDALRKQNDELQDALTSERAKVEGAREEYARAMRQVLANALEPAPW